MISLLGFILGIVAHLGSLFPAAK
jgi:hypothetical protein